METILGKFKLLKVGSGQGVSFYQFFEQVFMVASKHWTETHSFEW